MDEAIVELLKSRGEETKMDLDHVKETIALLDEDDRPTRTLTVKPLAELYGKGTGAASVEFKDAAFRPLLICIEEALLDSYTDHPSLSDADVLLVLDRLAMSPEGIITNDPLARVLQFSLRVTLSLNDYSRQDVRMALKKIKQSANRHNKEGGPRGYLNFIVQMLRPGR